MGSWLLLGFTRKLSFTIVTQMYSAQFLPKEYKMTRVSNHHFTPNPGTRLKGVVDSSPEL